MIRKYIGVISILDGSELSCEFEFVFLWCSKKKKKEEKTSSLAKTIKA